MARSIRGEFGQYYLVCLLSGRWSAVWHAFKGTEAFQAILREDQNWFDNQNGYARPVVFDTRADALQEIIRNLREAAKTRDDALKDYYELEIKKAQQVLDKLDRNKAKKGKGASSFIQDINPAAK